MANIGNNQVIAGVDGAVIGGVSIANTQSPLPTTIFGEDVVFDNPASALTIPQNYAFAIVGGIRSNAVDASTGFLKADGAQLQVRDMPNRGFLNADWPLGFNGTTVQFVNTSPERVRWPENAASGRLPFDGTNAVFIGQSVDVYSAAGLSGLASNTADAFLFHLGAGDTGVAFDRTGTLAADDLQGSFNGVSLDGISFAGAITLQIPADVDYIDVTFPDYNKVVAPEINNIRITAPKGAGVVRTVLKDGVMPFGTGIRAQAADGKVVIIVADDDAFVRYQNPASYGATPTFTETYSQIVTGGVNSGGGGSYWRAYGWKYRGLDVATGAEIAEGYIDFNFPSGHFAVLPSTVNTSIPSSVSDSTSGAILHSIDGDYWVVTDSANDVAQQNTTPNLSTTVIYTDVTPYYMDYLVEANITPRHVPTGASVDTFDETRIHDVQFSSDALVGDRTFANANDSTTGNSNATLAYAAVKRANRDAQTGPFGTLIDTSTNGAAEVSVNGNLVFSGSLPTALTSTGNVAVRVGSGFVGGTNNGATHNRWSASQVTLASGTTYANIAFEATGNLICIGAAFTNTITLNGNIIGLPSTFSGTIEDGSTVVVDANAQFNLEGAVIEGVVTLTSNEIGGTDVILDGDFTGTFAAGTGVNNIIIPVLYTVEPSLIAGTNGFFAIRNITTSSTIVVDAGAQFNLEGAVIEGTVTLTSNEIGGTDVILDGDFTGSFVAGTGVNNIIIPVLYTVEPSLIAGTNGFFAIRNITTSSTIVDVTILNGVIQGNSFFEVDATSTETYLAFYKLNSSSTGGQVYRVSTQAFSGTSLSRNTLIPALTVPAPFTESAISVRTDGDNGDAVTLSYGQSGNVLIGTWVNNTTQPTRPNAFQTMTAVIQASNSSSYFGWMESRGLTIDPTDYSSDGATLFNDSVTGLSGLSTDDGIRWNSSSSNIQSQVSQASGFFSDDVTGVVVQQVLSFDIGNAPLGTVQAALSPSFASLPTTNDLDQLIDEVKSNQQDLGAAFGDPTSAGKGVNPIIVSNPPA